MNILMVVPEVPFPPDHGGRTTVYNFLRQMKEMGHSVHLRAVCTEDVSSDCRKPLLPLCDSFQTTVADFRSFGQQAADAFLRQEPHIVRKYRSQEMVRMIHEDLQKLPIDVVHVEHYYCMQHVPSTSRVPVYLSTHNLEHEFYTQSLMLSRQLFNFTQREKVKQTEYLAMRRSDAVGFVSQRDLDIACRDAPIPAERAVVIPRGVDLARFPYQFQGANTKRLCFVGTMDFFPNEEACLWFAKSIFPGLLRAIPGLVFSIVGRNPTRKVRALHDGETIIVTGTVQDPVEFIRSSTLFVAPFQSAAGVKMKLLEAAALGIPMIGTPAATQGLPFGESDFCFVRAVDEWARLIGSLLDDPSRRESLARNARVKVEVECSWSRSGCALDTAYRRIAAKGA
jgi:glycosyltransferase involved in cell wall biosynthesis